MDNEIMQVIYKLLGKDKIILSDFLNFRKLVRRQAYWSSEIWSLPWREDSKLNFIILKRREHEEAISCLTATGIPVPLEVYNRRPK